MLSGTLPPKSEIIILHAAIMFLLVSEKPVERMSFEIPPSRQRQSLQRFIFADKIFHYDIVLASVHWAASWVAIRSW